jgi:hypothetical protein
MSANGIMTASKRRRFAARSGINELQARMIIDLALAPTAEWRRYLADPEMHAAYHQRRLAGGLV